MYKKNKLQILLYILPTLLLAAIIYGISVITLVGTSFTEWYIGSSPRFIGLDNYIEMFTGRNDFYKAFGNMVIWIGMQCVIHVSIGLLFALILSKQEWYWKIARTVYMIPNIISGAAVGMLFIFILNPEYGAVNNIIRAIGFKDFSVNWFMDYNTAFFSVTMMWLPYAAVPSLLFLAEIFSIDRALYESARIDGATDLQINLYVVIPLLKNTIGTAVILAATGMIQKLDIIMVTTGGGPGNETINLPMYIYKSALMDNNFGYANALGTFLIIFGISIIFTIRLIFKVGQSDM